MEIVLNNLLSVYSYMLMHEGLDHAVIHNLLEKANGFVILVSECQYNHCISKESNISVHNWKQSAWYYCQAWCSVSNMAKHFMIVISIGDSCVF